MIAISGANGHIGRHLARMLASAGIPARLLVRDVAKAETHGGPLEVVAADLEQPASLDAALAGVTHLFLVSPGPNTPAQDAAAIAAAQRAGVQHVVLLSSLGVELGGIGGGRAHASGEDVLKASGLEWTLLRPSEFMTNTLPWFAEARARGTISVPTGDGKVGYIDPADIAAVAFTALTTPGHVGKTYRITGPESLAASAVAERISAVLGTPVQHRDVSDAEFRAGAAQAHLPEMVIGILSEYYVGAKQGIMDILTPDVEQVTGKRPGTYADWARASMATV